ncbi:hypothetical protein WICPIJ_005453 [Wickerhamomyces pijperi]|uniref:Cell differentiation protein rcd1 n=1 Tax=Wickerhamomyces pijperi TaxID=599730 RepID=A0A9P8Q3X1_WICPI|nr:hypothetical protein WICPIJ_005453 [Wickerhamomyces pijperi]
MYQSQQRPSQYIHENSTMRSDSNRVSQTPQTTSTTTSAQAGAPPGQFPTYNTGQTMMVPPPPPGSSTTHISDNTSQTTGPRALDDEKVYQWIIELSYGPNREQALLELGKKREQYEDLPLVLWHSFGVMTSLLEEIISVYPALSPTPTLTSSASNRVCNALALLQCVASHPETRNLFLSAHIPLFLYPFLNTSSKQRPFEYLRLTSLGVIGALVKNDTPEVISFLLTTEIIPLCLRIMESSTELSKTVAIFIVQKILVDDAGLTYVCQTYERFTAVAQVLKNMVEQLATQQASRLLKHVVRCYLRLSDNSDARKALKNCLPEQLKDGTFAAILKDDIASKNCLSQLLLNLADYEGQPQPQAAPASSSQAPLNMQPQQTSQMPPGVNQMMQQQEFSQPPHQQFQQQQQQPQYAMNY